jgi:predicted HTH domain antitoxin
MSSPGIQVLFPNELAFALKMKEGEVAREVLWLAMIKLYELGKLSSGTAAKMIGMTRTEFLELAGEYQVSILGNPASDQIQQDFENA